MGGRAFPDAAKLSPSRAKMLLARLARELPFEVRPAGSFGHKQAMGDLDLVVRMDEFSTDVVRHLGPTRTFGRHTVSVLVQHDGRQHQVDFFPSVTLRWGEWARAGAPDSGPVRTLLLKAAASTFGEEGVDFSMWLGDQEVIRAGRTLDLQCGLRRSCQHRIRKDRRGLLSGFKSVTTDELSVLARRHVEDVTVLDDPEDVEQLILGRAGVSGSAASIAQHMRAEFGEWRLGQVRSRLSSRGVPVEVLDDLLSAA